MNANQLLSQAAGAVRRGALAEAEQLCRLLVETSPRHFFGWLLLADILLLGRRTDEALAAYDTANSIDSGYAAPFSRAAIIRFRAAFGSPPRVRSPEGETGARVQMTWLGS